MNSTIQAPDFQIDTSGEHCPYPVIAMLEAMQELQTGQVLEVLSDCSQTYHNVPASAAQAGYRVLKIAQEGSTLRYWIQR
ncbi:MAG: sulfurtransferase-like selenium metabolism protein YedF [Burkholderiaceae bacterium]|jgi:TusA-related sulfurtransferase|nr:sulfurtransferase-like selenium metabolism protein YedF [Burkholderiaceae bacterium]